MEHNTVNVIDLIEILGYLPEDSSLYITDDGRLCWLPVDDDNPGGEVVIHDDQYGVHLNPNGALAVYVAGVSRKHTGPIQ